MGVCACARARARVCQPGGTIARSAVSGSEATTRSGLLRRARFQYKGAGAGPPPPRNNGSIDGPPQTPTGTDPPPAPEVIGTEIREKNRTWHRWHWSVAAIHSNPFGSLQWPACPRLQLMPRAQCCSHVSVALWRLCCSLRPNSTIAFARHLLPQNPEGRKLLCGGGMARKPICPTPPLPLLGRRAGRGVRAGVALPAVPGGGVRPQHTWLKMIPTSR